MGKHTLSFMGGQSRLSPTNHLSPSLSAGEHFISFSPTVIETKKIPCFFSSFFFLSYFFSFLPLTAVSCKEETPTYVLPQLHGSEDFTSPAQFHDLGWMFMYTSSPYGFYLKKQQNNETLSTESLK